MPVSIIEHKGKEIIYIDHKGLTSDKMIECFKEANKEILKRKDTALTLADFTDTNISKEFIEYLKTDEVKPVAQSVKKEAIIGVSGIKKMVLNIYSSLTGSGAKVFNTREDAMDYLISG